MTDSVFLPVNPGIAQAYLDNMDPPARLLSRNAASVYVRALHAGRWHPLMAPVLLGGDGRLVTGQRLLNAIIQANMVACVQFRCEEDAWPGLVPVAGEADWICPAC